MEEGVRRLKANVGVEGGLILCLDTGENLQSCETAIQVCYLVTQISDRVL